MGSDPAVGVGSFAADGYFRPGYRFDTGAGLDSGGLGDFRFAIGQAEVTDPVQFSEHLDKLNDALCAMRDKRGLDFALLMVTDVVRGSSRLLLTNEPAELGDLPYPRQPDGTRLAEGVVSRKKQLLPVVLGLLED